MIHLDVVDQHTDQHREEVDQPLICVCERAAVEFVPDVEHAAAGVLALERYREAVLRDPIGIHPGCEVVMALADVLLR